MYMYVPWASFLQVYASDMATIQDRKGQNRNSKYSNEYSESESEWFTVDSRIDNTSPGGGGGGRQDGNRSLAIPETT